MHYNTIQSKITHFSIAKFSDCYVSAYPNRGLPNEFGEYDEPVDTMVDTI